MDKLHGYEAWVWVGSVGSIVMLLGSAALVPWLVVRAPADVFVREPPHRSGAAWLLLKIAKNLLGVVLIVLGILMLVLPGQGMITLLIGLVLLDLPGKRALLRRIVARPQVWRALAWIRERAHQPAFERP